MIENYNIVSDIDGSDQPYALYLPRGWNRNTRYPLVVSLHGAGTNHRVNMRRLFGVDERTTNDDLWVGSAKCEDHIVVCPFARGSMGYMGIAESDVLQTIQHLRTKYDIDENRMYLTGLSMGGGGALWLGLSRPDLWAGVAVVSPKWVAPSVWEVLGNAYNLRMIIFQGARDLRGSVEMTRKMVRDLQRTNPMIEYREYPDVGIPCWERAYRGESIFEWFRGVKRNRWPEKIKFQGRSYKYSRAYWVQFTQLNVSAQAKIEATFESRNHIRITTEGLSGFRLNIREHPLYSMHDPLEICVDNDAQIVEGEPSFAKRGGQWIRQDSHRPAGRKSLGAEGPICEAFAGRHVYVYGTADCANGEEQLRRRQQAFLAANWRNATWNLILGRYLANVPPPRVFFPVVSDKEIEKTDYRGYNFVLFGDQSTNRTIRGLSKQLPLELRPDARDYGLVFITVVQGRYVVVNSGLPWWVGANPSRRKGCAFLSIEQAVLNTFKDFVLFRGSLDNVIVEGWFDDEWRVRSQDKVKLEHDGACIVQDTCVGAGRF